MHLKIVVAKKGGEDDLHLNIREFLANASTDDLVRETIFYKGK